MNWRSYAKQGKLRLDRSLIPYIASKLIKVDDHWLWTGSLHGNHRDRPQIKIDGTNYYVARIVWEVLYGPIPDGLEVCHKCDIPNCLEPRHMFLGTHKDNMFDSLKKGHYACKLNIEQVEEAKKDKANGMTYQRIADKFGVGISTIYNIINGVTYLHLKEVSNDKQ
jgi:hypothetical protein